ncbi:MAG: hypothetical protein ONB31_15940 [candidate division KSB1 bacterium]|nr:hypothetical protein [candidate division KSB1 bacterium]
MTREICERDRLSRATWKHYFSSEMAAKRHSAEGMSHLFRLGFCLAGFVLTWRRLFLVAHFISFCAAVRRQAHSLPSQEESKGFNPYGFYH